MLKRYIAATKYPEVNSRIKWGQQGNPISVVGGRSCMAKAGSHSVSSLHLQLSELQTRMTLPESNPILSSNTASIPQL